MKKKLILLSILLISNFAFADNNDEVIKNFLDFQMNYLNEAINFEKSQNTPDADKIDKLLLCQVVLPTFFSSLIDVSWESKNVDTGEIDERMLLFLEPKRVKQLNKDLKSYFKIMSQDEDFDLFAVMMQIDEKSHTAPEPFEKMSTNHFGMILGNSFAYADGCDKNL